MTDLEDLKHQLYAKIQATSSPEPPPSHLDLLKYSELPSDQAHQSFMSDADEIYLIEAVTESRIRLESALNTAQRYSQVPALATALADAVTGCQQAVAILDDLKTYADRGDEA